jgi:hypothetical protein
MKGMYLILAILAVLFVASGAFAYSGFNRYYYTDNYSPMNYYPTPAYTSYSYAITNAYPTYVYNTSYYRAPAVAYYPTYTYYPTYSYVAPIVPAYYGGSSVSIYSNGDAWGLSISRGSVCGYYGYC